MYLLEVARLDLRLTPRLTQKESWNEWPEDSLLNLQRRDSLGLALIVWPLIWEQVFHCLFSWQKYFLYFAKFFRWKRNVMDCWYLCQYVGLSWHECICLRNWKANPPGQTKKVTFYIKSFRFSSRIFILYREVSMEGILQLAVEFSMELTILLVRRNTWLWLVRFYPDSEIALLSNEN